MREKISGPRHTANAQRLDLGWVTGGKRVWGQPSTVNVLKTHVLYGVKETRTI